MLKLTNPSGTAISNPATLTVTLNGVPLSVPVICSGTTASANLVSSFSYIIAASNSPTSFGATGLPAGLSLNPATGLISGTPSFVGAFTITLTATNGSGAGSPFTLTLTVAAGTGTTNLPPVITSPLSITVEHAGNQFYYGISASNSPTSFDAIGLPAGVSFNSGSAAVFGRPRSPGTYTITVSATNAYGTGSADVSLVVGNEVTPVVRSGDAAARDKSQFHYVIYADNMPPQILSDDNTRYYEAVNLPPGLSVDRKTGEISGTANTNLASFNVTLRAVNSAGTSQVTRVFKIFSAITDLNQEVNPAPLTQPAGATVYNSDTGSGGATNGILTWLSGPLPTYFSWRTYAYDNFTATGIEYTITPTVPGRYRFRLEVPQGATTNPIPTRTVVINVTAASFAEIVRSDLPGGVAPQALEAALPSTHWAMKNTGSNFPNPWVGSAGFDMNTVAVWNGGNAGSPNVRVLVIDTGVQDGNPSLTRVVGRRNFAPDESTNSSGLPFPQTLYNASQSEYLMGPAPGTLSATDVARANTESHGTRVAGAVAGFYPPLGIATGAAPGVEILSARVGAATASGSGLDIPILAWSRALQWGLDNQARISVTSLATTFFAGSMEEAYENTRGSELLRALYASPYAGTQAVGMLHFVASGNDGLISLANVIPARFASVIPVGAARGDGQRALFSNSGDQMGFVAPGERVQAGDPTWMPLDQPITARHSRGYTQTYWLNGTSFAAPYAAGVAALVWNQKPSLTATMVQSVLEGAARREPSWPLGHDPQYGFGLVDARAAAIPGLFKLVNLATRARVANVAAGELIMGFVISGNPAMTKPVLIRAVGPSLTSFGFSASEVLNRPSISVVRHLDGAVIASNSGWGNDPAISLLSADVGAFALRPTTGTTADAAVICNLPPGNYSAVITGVGGTSGVALGEVYDASGPEPVAVNGEALTETQVVNLASRALVESSQSVMIGSFVVTGISPRFVLIQAVGPSLLGGQFPEAITNPTIRLYRKTGDGPDDLTLVESNDDWESSANALAIPGTAAALGATKLLEGGKDAAILRSLVPGTYSVEVAGVGNSSGVALVEIYPLGR